MSGWLYKQEKEEEAGPGSLWNCGGSRGWRMWKPGREEDVVGREGVGGNLRGISGVGVGQDQWKSETMAVPREHGRWGTVAVLYHLL